MRGGPGGDRAADRGRARGPARARGKDGGATRPRLTTRRHDVAGARVPLDRPARAEAAAGRSRDALGADRPGLRRGRVAAADSDLTRQLDGEPLGERIIVTGRVIDEDGRPVRRRAGRGLAGERGRTVAARRRPAPGAARPELQRRGPVPHRRRRPLPVHDDQAGRLPVGQPSERLAPGAHPLLAVRPRVHQPARHPDVLPRRPAVRVRPDLQLGARPEGARAAGLRGSTRTTTTAAWALGYRFDIVLRGPRPTPLED